MTPGPHRILLPAGWPRPRGYSNGIAAKGTLVFVAGQIGWDAEGRIASGDLVAQTRQALANILAVLAEAGAGPAHVTNMTWYLTDLTRYRAELAALGAAYRDVMGSHYPAMAAVGVTGLVEDEAMVEIAVTAVVPD